MDKKRLRPGEEPIYLEDSKGQLDLNNFTIPNDSIYAKSINKGTIAVSKDYSVEISNPSFDSVEIHFRQIEERLVNKILQFKDGLILGCVAWLTSYKILNALAKCRNVQIIVQKEDFLRPDINVVNSNKWKIELHDKYNRVKCNIARHQFKSPIGHLSVAFDPTVDGIRCVGNHNSEKKVAFPRMHNKFMIFCETANEESLELFSYNPVSLWTGSFNLTQNATFSLENAVCFNDSSGRNEIINAYLNEHHQIFCLSEKLNWANDWIEPEFRIGT